MAEPRRHPVWRVLRVALPRRYRKQWGDDLLQAHIDRAGGIAGARGASFWIDVAYDVVTTSVSARADAMRASRRTAAAQRGSIGASTRMAFREITRAPVFAAVVAITLGLGITANLTMFSVLDRLLFSPADHVQDASTIRRLYVHGTSPFTNEDAYSAAFAYPDVEALGKTPAFKSVAIYVAQEMTVGKAESSERVPVEWASASYFPTLGAKPELGRWYSADEDGITARDHAAVIGYNYWMRRFGGRRDVLGSTLDIGQSEYRIIGVAPRGFTGVDISPIDIWLPIMTAAAIEQGVQWQHATGWYWLGAIARLKSANLEAVAQQQATALYHSARDNDRGTDPKAKVVTASIIAGRARDASRETVVAKMLGAVALLVLLMTCANAGNLFLARGVQRRRGLAVQTAIGVSRSGIIWQLFFEAVLIAVAAGIFAFALLRVTAPVLFRVLLPDATPPELASVRVAVVTFVFALATAMLAGLVTAFRSSLVAPFEALRAGRSAQRTSSMRRTLLAMQAAFAVILLLGAGLFLQSLRRASSVDFGMSLETEAMDFEMNNGTGPFDKPISPVVYAAEAALRGKPGIESVAVTSLPPLSGHWGLTVDVPGPDSIVSGPNGPFYFSAGPDYFRTLGMHMKKGRAIGFDDERPDVRVAVVNETMARSVWPNTDPIGQCLIVKQKDKNNPCTTVIGVVADTRSTIEDNKAYSAFFLPTHHPDVGPNPANYLLIRMKPGAHIREADLLAMARASSPGIRVVDLKTLRSLIASQLRSWQLGAALLTMFGILALLVAGAGLYSVVAFEVSQRRFELGMRSALGASGRRLADALLSEILATAVLGMLIGFVVSLILGRFAASLLYGVKPANLTVYAAVAGILIAVGIFAVLLPAWRVARTDPRSALATE